MIVWDNTKHPLNTIINANKSIESQLVLAIHHMQVHLTTLVEYIRIWDNTKHPLNTIINANKSTESQLVLAIHHMKLHLKTLVQYIRIWVRLALLILTSKRHSL
jgi:uncharacterized protein YueI